MRLIPTVMIPEFLTDYTFTFLLLNLLKLEHNRNMNQKNKMNPALKQFL
jgi:hypothetical protein